MHVRNTMSKNWIAGAIQHPGALHKEMGIAEGKKIPKAKLEKAAHKGGVLGKRARLAETLEGLHHSKKKSSKKAEEKAGRKGDKKLHEMAEKRHEKKASATKLEKKVYKQMKAGEKSDKKVHKDFAKMMKHEKREESKAGKKGDKKLHKMAVKSKMKKVMTEFKDKKLHSGSKKGPMVTNPKQAVAIAYSEAKKVGKKKK